MMLHPADTKWGPEDNPDDEEWQWAEGAFLMVGLNLLFAEFTYKSVFCLPAHANLHHCYI